MKKTIFFMLMSAACNMGMAQGNKINKQINRLFMFNDNLNGKFEKFDSARYFAFYKLSHSERRKMGDTLLAHYREECLPFHFSSDDDMVLWDESIVMTDYVKRPYGEMIYPHPPCFYFIRKSYYPNGNIKSKGRVFGQYTKIGMWYYFDSTGKPVKQVDEDEKFGRVSYKDVITLLSRENLINPVTGANADGIEAVYCDSAAGGSYWNVQCISRKDYFSSGPRKVILDKSKPREISEREARGYHFFRIDGETGKITPGSIIPEDYGDEIDLDDE